MRCQTLTIIELATIDLCGSEPTTIFSDRTQRCPASGSLVSSSLCLQTREEFLNAATDKSHQEA